MTLRADQKTTNSAFHGLATRQQSRVFGPALKVFWLKCGPQQGNFGDHLTPLLLDYFNVRFTWAPPEQANLIGIGSLCEKVPRDYTGAVWTAGNLYESTRNDFRSARVLALRGEWTRERTRLAHPVPLGDAGLLCHLFVPTVTKDFRIGIIPHYAHADDPVVRAAALENRHTCLIDICDSPRTVIRQVARCEYILSSSLHGLILADSLGIPNRWFACNKPILGDRFKFQDYYSIYGIDCPQPLPFDSSLLSEASLERYCDSERPGIAPIRKRLLEGLRAFLGCDRSLWNSILSVPMLERGIRLEKRVFQNKHRGGTDGKALPSQAGSPSSQLGPPSAAGRSGQEAPPEPRELSESFLIHMRIHQEARERFLVGCLSALKTLWSKGVYHRDICLQNMTMQEGQPRFTNLKWSVPAGTRPECDGLMQDVDSLRARDLQQLAQVFDTIAPADDPWFKAIVLLMKHPQAGQHIRDPETLQALVHAASPCNATSGSPGGDSNGLMLRHMLSLVASQNDQIATQRRKHARLKKRHWLKEVEQSIHELCDAVPPGSHLLLADPASWPRIDLPGRQVMPFPQQDGAYAGPPADGRTAVSELARRVELGATHVVFPVASFWWREYYTELDDYCRTECTSVVQNMRIQVFELPLPHKKTSRAEFAARTAP